MKKVIVFLCAVLCSNLIWSQVNYRGGSISYEVTDSLILKVLISTLTNIEDNTDSIQICWGDQHCTFLHLLSSASFTESNLKINHYEAVHQFENSDLYRVSLQQCCWGDGSINAPGAIDFPFYLFAEINFTNLKTSPNSAFQNNIHIDQGTVLHSFAMNWSSSDSDGDSSSFQLIRPWVDAANDLPIYISPDSIVPGPFNAISLSAVTGELSWDSPQEIGVYYLSFEETSYRNNLEIGKRNVVFELNIQESVTSTQTPDWASAIELFPNPTTGNLTIQLKDLPVDQSIIKIHDEEGKLMHIFSNVKSLDISHLPKGMYWLQIQTVQGLLWKKVIKL